MIHESYPCIVPFARDCRVGEVRVVSHAAHNILSLSSLHIVTINYSHVHPAHKHMADIIAESMMDLLSADIVDADPDEGNSEGAHRGLIADATCIMRT